MKLQRLLEKAEAILLLKAVKTTLGQVVHDILQRKNNRSGALALLLRYDKDV